ncbi:MAG: hypothetical protein KTR14_03140 [Vampirovibrio sp.]|nr:hypothetical protein [Vampirovibrio sp.]
MMNYTHSKQLILPVTLSMMMAGSGLLITNTAQAEETAQPAPTTQAQLITPDSPDNLPTFAKTPPANEAQLTTPNSPDNLPTFAKAEPATPSIETTPKNPHSKKAIHDKLGEKLNLTEEQKAQLDTLHAGFQQEHGTEAQAFRTKMRTLWQQKKSGDITKDEFKTQKTDLKEDYKGLMEARKSLKQEMKAVLTSNQIAQLDEMKAAWHQKHQTELKPESTQAPEQKVPEASTDEQQQTPAPSVQ